MTIKRKRTRRPWLWHNSLILTAIDEGSQAVSLPFALVVEKSGIGVAHRYVNVARSTIRGMKRKATEAN